MEFNKLSDEAIKELGCNCLEVDGKAENTSTAFARKIALSELTEEDFLSYYELGTPKILRNCKAHCMYRGVSIDILDDENKEIIKDKYRKSLSFAPEGFPPYYCEFKFTEGAGYVWDTRSEKNPTHYTLLKCDAFTIKHLSEITVEPLI